MKTSYSLKVAGLHRELPLCPINDDLKIAAFVMFGDVELTCRCAEELLKKAPEFDIIITAESKGIPLTYEMARLAGHNEYLVARKKIKLYMQDVITTEVNSITTSGKQMLCIGKKDVELMKGKRVLIADDVISTGESLEAIENLVNRAGGNIVGKLAVLAEGKAAERTDLIYLEKLPLFNAEGEIIK